MESGIFKIQGISSGIQPRRDPSWAKSWSQSISTRFQEFVPLRPPEFIFREIFHSFDELGPSSLFPTRHGQNEMVMLVKIALILKGTKHQGVRVDSWLVDDQETSIMILNNQNASVDRRSNMIADRQRSPFQFWRYWISSRIKSILYFFFQRFHK